MKAIITLKAMRNIAGAVALVAAIGFSFISCDLDEDDAIKTLPAGSYTTTQAFTTSSTGDTSEIADAISALEEINTPSFTVNDDGLITVWSFGDFFAWDSSSGVKYRFVLPEGGYLDFQVRPFGVAEFESWSPHPATLNSKEYEQSITGLYDSKMGIVRLILGYQRTDSNGTATRMYELKKQ